MKYFDNFVDALSSADLAPIENRAYASDGPALSFSHLDDRAFEVLTYRLLSKRGASTQSRVTLMQGVGERGRDVICYDASGQLQSIAQCKLLKERLVYPDLVRELLKLALHRYLDPDVVREGLVYEIWAPGGFTEPAAQLVDTWPHGWSEEKLEPLANAVINQYAAFNQLRWSMVRESVLQFASLIEPRKLSREDISVLVRATTEIFESFFIAKHVVDVSILRQELKSALAEDRATAASHNSRAPEPSPLHAESPPQPLTFFQPRPAPSTFTGRESTLATARTTLSKGRIVVLAGAGGIGKSAIASRLVEESAAVGISNYWLDGSQLDRQLAMLAFTLSVPWTSTNAQPLSDKLESLGACIVLDGLVFTPAVRGIPRPSHRVSIIATTRERGISPLLPYEAELLDISVLPRVGAHQLLRLLVGLPFPWTDEEADEVVGICGCLPLALVLAASALRKRRTSGAKFIDELRAAPIDTLDSNTPPEQPGIQRTFAIALAELSPEERTALIGLSVCADDSWVDIVAFATQRPNDVIERALSALEAISLVERQPSHPLWSMHDVIRYMCLQQPVAQQFALRHAFSAMRQVELYRRPEDWAYIEVNLGQIFVAAERLSRSGLAEEVGATIRELIPHLRDRGTHGPRTHVIRHLSEQLLPMLPKKSIGQAYYIGQLGMCAFSDGDYKAAEQLLEQSRKIYKAMGSRTGEVATLANMALLDEEAGKLDRAANRYQQAADTYQASVTRASKRQKVDLRRQGLIARWSLARVEARRGNHDRALKALETVLRASTSADLRDMHARAIWYKARILGGLKRYEEALELGRQAVHELHEVGLASELLHALHEFAKVALTAGFPKRALQAAEHAARLSERMADFEELSLALTLQTCAFWCMDNVDEATKTSAAARNAARLASDPATILQRIEAMEALIERPPATEAPK